MNDTPPLTALQSNGSSESLSLPPDDDFLELLARVRGGDDSAAAELVQRYERAVLRSVRSRLGKSMRSAMDSMDVMQSVHRSLLTGVKNQRFQLRTPQQLIGLAVVMVQRKVARHWRKLKQFPDDRQPRRRPERGHRARSRLPATNRRHRKWPPPTTFWTGCSGNLATSIGNSSG